MPTSADDEREFGRLINWMRTLIGVVLIGFAVGGYAIVDLIGKNTQAIEVGCTLLVRAINETGAGATSHTPPKPGKPLTAGQAAQARTAILVTAITRGLTDAERREVVRLSVIVDKAGGVVTVPDCREIARDPKPVGDLSQTVTAP